MKDPLTERKRRKENKKVRANIEISVKELLNSVPVKRLSSYLPVRLFSLSVSGQKAPGQKPPDINPRPPDNPPSQNPPDKNPPEQVL